jgi:hypothetical protein
MPHPIFGNSHQIKSFSPFLNSVGDLFMVVVSCNTSDTIGLLNRNFCSSQNSTTAYLAKLNSSGCIVHTAQIELIFFAPSKVNVTGNILRALSDKIWLP